MGLTANIKGPQGDVGPQGPAGVSPWVAKKKDILAGTSEIVDEIDVSVFTGVKYFFCIADGTNTVMFDMSVINKTTSTSDVIYAKIGSGISYEVDTAVVSGVMQVTIANTGAVDIYSELISYTFTN